MCVCSCVCVCVCVYVCVHACRERSVMRKKGQNPSLTSKDKHMTSVLRAGQWKKQHENNVSPSVRPLVPSMGSVEAPGFYYKNLNCVLRDNGKTSDYLKTSYCVRILLVPTQQATCCRSNRLFNGKDNLAS